MKRHTVFAVTTVTAVSLAMTVLLMGISCTTEADGSGDFYYDDNHTNNSNQNQDNTQQENVYRFTRHAFMEQDAAISSNASTAEKAAWASKHFDDALAYMKDKVAAYENRLEAEGLSDNFLKNLYEESIKSAVGEHGNILDQTHVDDLLNRKNLIFPWIMGGMSAKLVTVGDPSTVENHQSFKAHYSALALRAYNDSLGTLRNSQTMPFNQDYDQINSTLQGYTHGAYTANDYRDIEDALYDMLRTVSDRSGISLQTLVDTVDLSLLYTSLWGARDLGAKSGVQLSHEDELQAPNYNKVPYLNNTECLREVNSGYMTQMGRDITAAQQQQQQNGLTR